MDAPMDATTPSFSSQKADGPALLASVDCMHRDAAPAAPSRGRAALLNVLKLCGKEKNLEKVRGLHAELIGRDLIGGDGGMATAFVTAYARCGAMQEALGIFRKIPVRNTVSWSALIAGYTQNGLGHEALGCFEHMRDDNVRADAITYVSVLKACGMVGSLEIGEYVDAEVRKQGLLQEDVILGNALADMYAKCGAVEKAQQVFEQLRVRDVISWSSLISGYVQCGHAREALRCFQEMQDTGICPNGVTYISVSRACGILGSLVTGEGIVARARKEGLLKKDVVLGNALIDMYTRCGTLQKAQELFEELPVRNVVSWNVLIAGYTQNGFGHEALETFRKMQDAGVCPDAVTYISILKACGIVGSLEIGVEIDTEVRKKGLLQKDIVLGTALVGMYSKCGALDKARELLEQLPVRNVVTWSALISGYVQNGLASEALQCFRRMQVSRVRPDAVTYACILKACGILGSLDSGEDIYVDIRKQGRLLQKDVVLGNALVDMYSKCGVLEKALDVFKCLPVRNVVSWSSLIAGYTQLGQSDVVLTLYRRMKEEGVMPNPVTFIVLLTACSHAGLVKEGGKLFDEMYTGYALIPTLEHYTCMVDLIGRAGDFDKMKALLDEVPTCNHIPLLLSILGACSKWRDVRFGRWAFKQIISVDGNCAAAYVCMESIYAGSWNESEYM
jgi:pentatricopeptide repeat protein